MRKKKGKIVVFIFVLFLLFVMIFLMNVFNLGLIEKLKIKESLSPVGMTNGMAGKGAPKRRDEPSDRYIRKERLDVSREYSQSIIYEYEKEIARFKTKNHRVYDVQGEIPRSEVKFFNESTGSYGFEQYRRGKRDGDYIEYYRDGPLKRKAYYFNGKIMRMTEFYIDNTVRMEVDYTDTLILSDDLEIGRGKVFYRDGRLMYEWSLTNREPVRYKKSYNKDGELVETKLYDDKGNLIKRIDHRK